VVGVRPVLELRVVVVSLDLFDLEPFGPGIDEPLLRSLEIILDVALATDSRLASPGASPAC
jgi:hypothetical protein